MIGTDDTSPTGPNTLNAELYMYVADNAQGVLNGSGKLYVFSSTAKDNSGYLETGKPISGKFVEITNPGSLNPGQLQTAVDALPSADKAFKFVRLEDVDYDHRPGVPGQRPAIYFVDTGNNVALCNGTPCDLYGSIYRLELDASNPTQNAQLVLLARSRGVAAGDWASPDNIAAGRQSLMLQEDPAYAGFNRAERMWNFKFRNDGSLGEAKAVVELENQQLTGNICSDAAGTLGIERDHRCIGLVGRRDLVVRCPGPYSAVFISGWRDHGERLEGRWPAAVSEAAGKLTH